MCSFYTVEKYRGQTVISVTCSLLHSRRIKTKTFPSCGCQTRPPALHTVLWWDTVMRSRSHQILLIHNWSPSARPEVMIQTSDLCKTRQYEEAASPFCAWRTLSQKENFRSLIVSLNLKVSAKSGPQDRNAQLVITGQSDIHHGVCMKCFRYMFMKCFLAASSDSGGQPDTAGHHQSRSDNDMNLITPHTSHLTPHTSHLTPHTSHLIPHTSYLIPHISGTSPSPSTPRLLSRLDCSCPETSADKPNILSSFTCEHHLRTEPRSFPND